MSITAKHIGSCGPYVGRWNENCPRCKELLDGTYPRNEHWLSWGDRVFFWWNNICSKHLTEMSQVGGNEGSVHLCWECWEERQAASQIEVRRRVALAAGIAR